MDRRTGPNQFATYQPTNFFHKESKSKKKKNFFFQVGGVCLGGASRGGEGVHGWTDKQAKPICPFNFFQVGSITMH